MSESLSRSVGFGPVGFLHLHDNGKLNSHLRQRRRAGTSAGHHRVRDGRHRSVRHHASPGRCSSRRRHRASTARSRSTIRPSPRRPQRYPEVGIATGSNRLMDLFSRYQQRRSSSFLIRPWSTSRAGFALTISHPTPSHKGHATTNCRRISKGDRENALRQRHLRAEQRVARVEPSATVTASQSVELR